MTYTQYPHLSDAVFAVVAELRAVSARLQDAEPTDKLKRWALACEMCRTAGADFSLDPEEAPSPLAQIVDSISKSTVRIVKFDHNNETLTLHPWGVGEPPVQLPLSWFDDALVMVDRDWGARSYPYEAPLASADGDSDMTEIGDYPDWVYTPSTRGGLNVEERTTRELFYRAGSYNLAPELAQLSVELIDHLASLSNLATAFSKRYLAFSHLKNEQSAAIPSGGCEAELALYARPEIKNVDEAVWRLTDLLSIEHLSSKDFEEPEVGQ